MLCLSGFEYILVGCLCFVSSEREQLSHFGVADLLNLGEQLESLQ